MTPLHRIARSAAALLFVAAIAFITACQPASRALSPADFEAQSHDLLGRREFVAAQRLIAERERQLPGDPEAIIARANLYYRQSTSPVAIRGPEARATASSDTVMFDTLLARRSLETLTEGIHRHPSRLDMRVGLIYLFQEMGLRIPQVELFQETVAYSLAHPDSLRWTYGEPLPMPAEQFVPEALHKYVDYYAKRGAPGDDVAMLALAQVLMNGYPRSPYAATDVASYYGQRGQWGRTLEFLKMAERADSTDALVLYNIGLAHEQLRQPAPAVEYFRRAIMSGVAGRNDDVVVQARGRLAAHGVTVVATPR